MYSNYHSHSTFCDGRSVMEDFVKFAMAHGISKYGFSSHAPLPFHTQWTMNEDDYPDYEKEFGRLKRKYDGKIELFLGLEVDFIHECSSVMNDFFKGVKLDYAIGSVHYLDKFPDVEEYWSVDGPLEDFRKGVDFFCGGDIRLAAKRFFEVSAEMIEMGGIDIVGHADKITLHGSKYGDFSVSDAWFYSLMGEYLELIKSKNLILEINTKSLREKGITFPHQCFYPLIKELEIPVQVNSDCHYPTHVTEGFAATYKALYEVGFKTMQQLTPAGWVAVEFDERGLKL